MQLFAKFKKILQRGFRATLNFRKFKVALNPGHIVADHIVAMVTYCATKLTATCSPIIGQFADTMIVASTGIGDNDPSNSRSWKVLETVSTHLQRKEIRI